MGGGGVVSRKYSLFFSLITVHFRHGQYTELFPWAELDTGITNTELTLHVSERPVIRKSLSSLAQSLWGKRQNS